MVALFARGRDEADVQEDLEESRDADLVAAHDAGDEEAVADGQAEWCNRLRRTLRADSAAAAELRAPLDELAPATDQGKGSVTNTFSGGVQHGTFIQAGNIGRLTVGEPPR